MDNATIESSCITLAKDNDDNWDDDNYSYGDTCSDEEDDSSSGEEDNTDDKVPKAKSTQPNPFRGYMCARTESVGCNTKLNREDI
eukprot:CAMPEP_0168288416 /NCGR_PEP_ID=MMETSP0142_2-20121227/3271_1 /TAXON_ID=44445 /ORGANISM="Pseudo-nitzschia australis, Strain 10249 10 AB" /LENGTH=84 /DNA_ID=CAMNT_0008234389 /DNA_START=129 /DNA_END=380 /DNA_ORIENTATION=-